MEYYYLTFTVLCCVTICRAFLLSDDGRCGEGCVVRLQVLSNSLHCVCPGTHDNRNQHHDHGHHHLPHETKSPQPTVNLGVMQLTTTSLCAEGCHLELNPFHYCKCPLSTATTNVQNLSPSVTDTNVINSEAQTTPEETVSTDSIHELSTPYNQDVSTTLSPTTTATKALTTSVPTHKSTRHPSTVKTTQDICDILCAQQLGGDACHCSKPGLPG